MKKAIVLLVFCGALAGALSALETTKTLSLEARDIRRLDIRAGAGSLTVTGREGLASIEVKAVIVAPGLRDKDTEGYVRDEVELTLEKRGDVAALVGRIRQHSRIFHFGDDARVDLTVTVPKSLDVAIDDGSGDIVVEDLAAALRIDDGSGPIRVSRIKGNVRIDDGSGEISVERVEGNLEIDDGSGDLEASDVTGDVTVDDGSGGIRVRRVAGTVTVDDGSGGVDIKDVDRDVRLINTGSGSVDIAEVKGKVIR